MYIIRLAQPGFSKKTFMILISHYKGYGRITHIYIYIHIYILKKKKEKKEKESLLSYIFVMFQLSKELKSTQKKKKTTICYDKGVTLNFGGA